ncbi:MAG: polysaccharide deacetylase family protein [Deltaproteobacteria bacterium]|nr:polysaccharide deacetylase family protein [Deltaproteobacteria bacterium]
MYHSISDDPEPGHPYFWINTSPRAFAQQLHFLGEQGYRVIPLAEAVNLIRAIPSGGVSSRAAPSAREPQGGRGLDHALGPDRRNSPRYAVLTFDDGYRDFYTQAFPLLKAKGFPASVFLPTDFIGRPAAGLRGKAHLSWAEILELQRQGITFGSHTCSHPQLAELQVDQLRRELSHSGRVIQEQTGGCDGFCYPFQFPQQDGLFLEVLNQTLQSVGYAYCLSTRIGTVNTAEDLFSLKRIPINSGDDPALFQAKLQGGYDWLSGVQALKKVLWKA